MIIIHQYKVTTVILLWSLCATITPATTTANWLANEHLAHTPGGQTVQVESNDRTLSPNSRQAGKISPSRSTRHAHDITPKTFVDLTHPLLNSTLHWPKNNGFQYSIEVDGEFKNQRNESYHLKSDKITMAVHSGTHLDAPRHFSKTGWTVDKIPLKRLIDIPVSMIDVSAKVKANNSYSFVKEDFIDNKTKESLVQPNSVVLVYTGVSQLYDQGEKSYFGTDTKNISAMKIPGFGPGAALYLVERQVYGVGLDAPSADSSERHGSNNTMDPRAHIVLNSNNIYILENINSRLQELLRVPTSSVKLTILPLPIVDGSGSPVRLVASIGIDECETSERDSRSSAVERMILSYPVILLSSLSLLVIAIQSIHI